MNISCCKNLFDLLEKEILFTEQEGTMLFDKDNILGWRDEFIDQLGRYIDLERSVRGSALPVSAFRQDAGEDSA